MMGDLAETKLGRATWLSLSLCLVILTAGCSDPSGGRAAVTGTVTLKGAPLKYGTIEFQSQAPTPECYSGAVVADGKYNVPAESGLLPGKYIVRVSSTGDVSAAVEELPGEAPPPPANIIPPEYSTASQVTLEVTGDDAQFDVAIP